MSEFIILHGTKGSPEGNWFPWLKNELKSKNHSVFVPRFPTPENQSRDSWCHALQKQAPKLDEHTTLIGHSLGVTLMLHVLEMTGPIHQSLFVAPVLDKIGHDEYDTLNSSFIKKTPDFDWTTISNHAGDCHIFHAHDDPYVPAWHAQQLHTQIGGILHVIEGGGHLNAESGYTEFPELLEVINV